jgi:hypothetical protein
VRLFIIGRKPSPGLVYREDGSVLVQQSDVRGQRIQRCLPELWGLARHFSKVSDLCYRLIGVHVSRYFGKTSDNY